MGATLGVSCGGEGAAVPAALIAVASVGDPADGGLHRPDTTAGGGVWPGRQVDDLGFLDQVLDEVQADYAVDADRIYMMGHSNGGMLTHQYACDRPGWSGAMSTPTASDFWRGRNGCAADPAVTEVPDRTGGDGSTVRVHDYDCPAGTDVVVHEVIGGGHQWFGAGDILPRSLLGNNNHDQAANKVFWDFLSRFRL